MRFFFVLAVLWSGILSARTLDQQIANMFVLGFYGTQASPKGIVRDICDRGLGGVILFDRHPTRHAQAKNIASATQLKRLTHRLSTACAHQPLIAIDQEGGTVQRIRFSGRYPRAASVGKGSLKQAARTYGTMAHELARLGLNYDLAPIADLAINPANRVIVKLGRAYGKDPERVARYDAVFLQAMHRYGVLTALKHFPGHGSSRGDTHKGFVDVTRLWSERELEPYRRLIQAGRVDSIMVAHVFNRHLDTRYPASLSRKTVHGLLRKKLGYRGVVITDDLQMRAISQHYSLRTVIALAINAGDDLLLFGNQLAPGHEVHIADLVAITRDLLARGIISRVAIARANRRIDAMKHRIGLRP